MRGRIHLLLIGQVLLCALMFSGVLDMGAVAHASETPRCVIAASYRGSLLTDDQGDSVATWRQQHATLLAKHPQAKSALPCQLWSPLSIPLTMALRARADFPQHTSAALHCYAIHPRPPSRQ